MIETMTKSATSKNKGYILFIIIDLLYMVGHIQNADFHY
jgi:hypothetical protein